MALNILFIIHCILVFCERNISLFYIVTSYLIMPPKDPELIALRKELEDLIAKCQVITHVHLLNCIYIFIYKHICCVMLVLSF